MLSILRSFAPAQNIALLVLCQHFLTDHSIQNSSAGPSPPPRRLGKRSGEGRERRARLADEIVGDTWRGL